MERCTIILQEKMSKHVTGKIGILPIVLYKIKLAT